jgi:hypothetical protein
MLDVQQLRAGIPASPGSTLEGSPLKNLASIPDPRRVQTMAEELDSLEELLSSALKEALIEREDCFE